MIKNDAKIILRCLLDQSISQGSLEKSIPVRFDLLAEEIGFDSPAYCRVCCEYLNQLNYAYFSQDPEDISNKGLYFAKISAAGIDFLESTT